MKIVIYFVAFVIVCLVITWVSKPSDANCRSMIQKRFTDSTYQKAMLKGAVAKVPADLISNEKNIIINDVFFYKDLYIAGGKHLGIAIWGNISYDDIYKSYGEKIY